MSSMIGWLQRTKGRAGVRLEPMRFLSLNVKFPLVICSQDVFIARKS